MINCIITIILMVGALVLNFNAEVQFFGEGNRKKGFVLNLGSVICFLIALISLCLL